jgi:hypothetical protein
VLLHHQSLLAPERLVRLAAKLGMWGYVKGMAARLPAFVEDRRARARPSQADPLAFGTEAARSGRVGSGGLLGAWGAAAAPAWQELAGAPDALVSGPSQAGQQGPAASSPGGSSAGQPRLQQQGSSGYVVQLRHGSCRMRQLGGGGGAAAGRPARQQPGAAAPAGPSSSGSSGGSSLPPMPASPFAAAAMRRTFTDRTSSSSGGSGTQLEPQPTHDSAASAAGNGRARRPARGGAGRVRALLAGQGAGDLWRMALAAAVGSLAAWLLRRGKPRRPHPRLLAMPGSCSTDEGALGGEAAGE